MITSLRGILREAFPPQITVEVGGVGYELLLPLSSFDRLPEVGQEIHILTHLAVREDAHTLYGFMTASERELFRLLIHTVSGIGPKRRKALISRFGGLQGILDAGVDQLTAVPGISRELAEKIYAAMH